MTGQPPAGTANGAGRNGEAAGRQDRNADSRRGQLVLVGTSHRVASVAIRERLIAWASEGDAARTLLRAVRAELGPAVVLSTCNRLEVYCWTARHRPAAARRLVQLLATPAELDPAELGEHLYVRSGEEAILHLIRVTAGLDSLAFGESQILGQVRRAWLDAASEGRLGAALDELFRHAIESARRLRSAGAFDRHPSVANIAVGAAAGELRSLMQRRTAVLGAGVTGKAAARALASAGAAHVSLLNRTPEHAATVAQTLGLGDRIAAGPLGDLRTTLAEVDVVVCATASPSQVVSYEDVAAALPARAGRPLVVLDIAVPRDVDARVRELPGVTLIDLDDLESRCALDVAARRRELERVEALAVQAAREGLSALRVREAVPDIVALRRHAEAIREAELRRFAGRLSGLAPEERAAVEQVTRAIMQKLLHPPTVALRSAASAGGSDGRRHREEILSSLRGQRASRREHESAASGQAKRARRERAAHR